MSHLNDPNMQHRPTSGDSDITVGRNQDLSQYITVKDGQAQIVFPTGLLPDFIAHALHAVNTGQRDQARALLNADHLDGIDTWVKDHMPSRDLVYFLLGTVLHKLDQVQDAVQWYEKILENQSHAFVLQELARLYRRLGKLDLAVAYAQQVIEMDPGNIEQGNQMATDLMYEGHMEQGISLLRTLMEVCPPNAWLHSNLLFLLHHLPDISTRAIREEHWQWGRIHAPIQFAKRNHANDPDARRRLRIGYLSSDFRRHSVAYTFEALLDGRSADQAELYAYGSVSLPDEITERFKQKFDVYRDIYGWDDQAVAQLIEQDRIDILVAVAGHTRDHRLTVLAYKAAPIQVNFGWINTLGIEQVDYLLTDELLTPPDSQSYYREKFVHLPGSSLCYAPPVAAPEVASLPAGRNGFVTFGSFNKRLKINRQVISLWARVLHAVPGSRLVLKFERAENDGIRTALLRPFAEAGIGVERIDILGYRSPEEHFQLYNQIDIALDTTPFNGCVTTLESLWMGVPVISLTGQVIVSRIGLTLLQRVGLDYFAAVSPDDYVSKAVALAQNLEALGKIRMSLRPRMMSSSLLDATRFVDELDKGYREMWRQWCYSRAKTPVKGVSV